MNVHVQYFSKCFIVILLYTKNSPSSYFKNTDIRMTSALKQKEMSKV